MIWKATSSSLRNTYNKAPCTSSLCRFFVFLQKVSSMCLNRAIKITPESAYKIYEND